ncbi:hypothetical protein VitviT2T_008633 [Vitis vinifera]|uniref:Protein kinase domain-containing protein n=2 Tax=Vitis vinifera TaxID=29760 RepID=A0ABY9C2E7_VITVI
MHQPMMTNILPIQVIDKDIKPSNLMVNHKGEVNIIDFGVSTMLASSFSPRNTFVGVDNYILFERIK